MNVTNRLVDQPYWVSYEALNLRGRVFISLFAHVWLTGIEGSLASPAPSFLGPWRDVIVVTDRTAAMRLNGVAS